MAFCLAFLLTMGVPLSTASAVVIDTAPVGDAGNPVDPLNGVAGSVAYDYQMGTYEVTNSQYAEFLNWKAASVVGLYNTNMGSDPRGGINRSGVSGSYTYEVKPNMGDKPVNWVSIYDAMRFANWLSNGQGTGDTESGSYAMWQGLPSRQPNATWVVPTANEWYKAAYYDPRSQAQGGPPGDDHYWFYPTQSDTQPIRATATSTGNIANPGANVANTMAGADWNGQDGNVTAVGSAGPLSRSYYGTYDQGGNVAEWTPTELRGGAYDALMGGTWLNSSSYQPAATAGYGAEDSRLGFRLALVPEPGTLELGLLSAVGGYVLAIVRRRITRRNMAAD
jgi:formylglycine-generating enzyme required for sulfatase activity